MIKLKEIRKSRRMSQKELADAVSFADPTITQTAISVLECGEMYPTEKLMRALCLVLDCSEADLYDGEAMFVNPNREFSETTEVLSGIFSFYNNPIPRERLREILSEMLGRNVSDRMMRKMIETAKNEGMVICNAQDNKGYFLPSTIEELEAQLRSNERRAMAILRQNKVIRREINDRRNFCERV